MTCIELLMIASHSHTINQPHPKLMKKFALKQTLTFQSTSVYRLLGKLLAGCKCVPLQQCIISSKVLSKNNMNIAPPSCPWCHTAATTSSGWSHSSSCSTTPQPCCPQTPMLLCRVIYHDDCRRTHRGIWPNSWHFRRRTCHGPKHTRRDLDHT